MTERNRACCFGTSAPKSKRRSRRRPFAAIALLALASGVGAACSGPPRPKAEPQPLVVPKHAPPVDWQPSADELPVPEDFELEAEREITRTNMRTELLDLEREIAGKPSTSERAGAR